ncbi:hypothetical protein Q7P37_004622 [Cladosporium fusiforme]
MFDSNFNFSRSPSWASSSDNDTPMTRSVSPCSPLSAFPPPPQGYSVTDLAADLDRQRIRPDAQIAYQPCESYANTTDDDSAWDIPPALTRSDSEGDSTYSGSMRNRTSSSLVMRNATSTTRSYSPSRRSARQSGTRMLCASSNHAKDIAQLVSRMVSSSDQCSITSPPSTLPQAQASASCDSDSSADDEGYNSCSAAEKDASMSTRRSKRDVELGYRRAYDSRSKIGGSAAIAKEIRFRGKERSRSTHHHQYQQHRRHRISGEKTTTVV